MYDNRQQQTIYSTKADIFTTQIKNISFHQHCVCRVSHSWYLSPSIILYLTMLLLVNRCINFMNYYLMG